MLPILLLIFVVPIGVIKNNYVNKIIQILLIILVLIQLNYVNERLKDPVSIGTYPVYTINSLEYVNIIYDVGNNCDNLIMLRNDGYHSLAVEFYLKTILKNRVLIFLDEHNQNKDLCIEKALDFLKINRASWVIIDKDLINMFLNDEHVRLIKEYEYNSYSSVGEHLLYVEYKE